MRLGTSAEGGIFARLSEAAADFRRAWGRPVQVGRDPGKRITEAMLTLALCAGCVAIGAFYDASVSRAAAGLPAGVIRFFAVVTHAGASGYIFALTVLCVLGGLAGRGRGKGWRADAALAVLAGRAFYLFTVAAVSGLASQALKHAFGRARPKLLDMVGPLHFDAFSYDATYASFPSGHAVTAFAMASALGALAPKLRWPLLALAVLVAASRVILSAHYLSDILAGAALGHASAMLVRRAFASRRIVFEAGAAGAFLRAPGLLGGVVRRAAGR